MCFVNKEQVDCDQDDSCSFTAAQMQCSATETATATFNATDKYMNIFIGWFNLCLIAWCGSFLPILMHILPKALYQPLLVTFNLVLTFLPLLWYIDSARFVFSIAGKVSAG